MSAKIDLYNGIKSAIENKLTSIQTIRLYNMQFDNEATENAFAYPCVFIEFADISWETSLVTPEPLIYGNQSCQQKGECKITLHCGFEKYENETESFSSIMDIIDEIYYAVQSITGANYTSLIRVAERQDINHYQVIVWQIDFTTMISELGQIKTNKIDANDPIGIVSVSITNEVDIDNLTIRTGDNTF